MPLSTFFITPINVVTVTQQIGNARAGESFLRTYRNVKKAEDWQAFLKGYYTQCLATVVEDRARRWVSAQVARTSWKSSLLPELPILVGHLLTYPLKLIRTRLIQQVNHEKYQGAWNCFIQMRQQEGTFSMYSGLLLDTVRVVIGLLFNNWAHDALTVRVFKRLPSSLALFAGVPAELLLGFITFPLSTIVTKVQAQVADAPKNMLPDVKANDTLACIRSIYRKNKVLSLWNGYFGFCLRTVAQMAAITFLTHAVWKVDYLRNSFLGKRR
jgi:hypothetical protein